MMQTYRFFKSPVTLILIALVLLTNCTTQQKPAIDINAYSKQLSLLLSHANEAYNAQKNDSIKKVMPRTLKQQKISFVKPSDWCSGFFPGSLWLMSDLTGDKKWQQEAQKFTQVLKQEQWNNHTHDMGFKIMCSYGQGYAKTKNPEYKNVIIQAAKTLATRFNKNTGCIRSWDWNADEWKFPVIIDNMMNLELLLKATELSEDSTYYNIAVSHANTTLKNHFRKDNSSYHVVDYDPKTGEVLAKFTFQGDTDDSAWVRGQAWGLYGFTMMFRETGDSTYLKEAKRIATYIFNHPNLPSDKIPMWDFNYNETSGEPRDVSAAAVIASALYDLANLDSENKNKYTSLANEIMNNLATKYISEPGNNKGFILDHSVGFKHRNHEVDVPLNYADYYFLEALNKHLNK